MAFAAVLALLPLSSAQADRDLACANAPEGAFADVVPGSTHAANIDCIAAYGITVGVGGGNYDPNGPVSRGQMASFLVNFTEVALDQPQEPPTTPSSFEDISGTTHATNIAIAAELGITIGRTPTTYAPGLDVTRAQMATFVVRTIEASGGQLPANPPTAFSDHHGSVHEINIDRLASVDIVRGVGGGVYDPGGSITRAQMATFLANAAGYLYDQGVWLAPLLPSGGPQIILAAQAPGTSDTIEVHWDRSVTVDGSGAAFVVREHGGDQPAGEVVATGTSTTHDGHLTTLSLDSTLEVDDVYWLTVDSGVAVDAQDRSNDPQVIAFAFAVDPGDSGDSDDDGSPAAPPEIASVVTDPENDLLLVTFDQPVVCPTTTAGAAAWLFSNDSIDDGSGHASGIPDSVAQDGAPSSTCSLVYDGSGVGNGDFGTLSYTQPGDEGARVTSDAGVPLQSTTGVTVVDGVAPTFTGLSGHAGTDSLTMLFSEPVLCLSLQAEDLEVERVEGESIAVTGFDCDEATSDPIVLLPSGSLQVSEHIRVRLVGEVYSHSEHHTVPPAEWLTFVG